MEVSEELHTDLQKIMVENGEEVTGTSTENSFQKIFFMQQTQAASHKSSCSMRWHPVMIKWCLYLGHFSSKAYDTLRESGCHNELSHHNEP